MGPRSFYKMDPLLSSTVPLLLNWFYFDVARCCSLIVFVETAFRGDRHLAVLNVNKYVGLYVCRSEKGRNGGPQSPEKAETVLGKTRLLARARWPSCGSCWNGRTNKAKRKKQTPYVFGSEPWREKKKFLLTGCYIATVRDATLLCTTARKQGFHSALGSISQEVHNHYGW